MAEDIKLVIETDNPTVVVTTANKVDIKNAAKSSDINFIATGSSGIKGDTGPQGPAGTGLTAEQASAIDANTAKNSFDNASVNKLNNIEANAQVNRALLDEDNMVSDSDTLAPTQQSVKAYVDGQTHLELGTTNTTALAGNTTTISTEQASAITANTSKTGITTSQANAITANTAKPDLTVDGAGTVHPNNYTDTVYTHPANHAISVITGLQSALDAKVDDSQVLTNVPANAVFTDTNTTYSIQDGELSQNNFTDADHTKLNGIEASADVTDTANVTSSGALMDSELTDLAGVKGVTISTLQVKPSEGAFANGDKTKLDAIEASADVTDAANVTSAGALMDSELTDLAGVKGVTISTLQVKPSEGAFANGDKTKLDSIAANATADQTNVTGSSGSCTGNAATATALTAGDKTIDGKLTIGANQAGHDFELHGATTNFSKCMWDASNNQLHFTDQAKIVFGTGGGPGGSDSSIQANGSNLVITNSAGNIQIGDTVEITGDLDVTGSVLPGITYIKILPSDFIPDDVGRPAQIDDTGSDRWLKSHDTAKLYVSVEIPLGFKATHVDVYGSGTSAVTVYEADIDSKTVTSKGTGNIGTQIDITDVTADATNYLLIELVQTSSEEVYGGKVTIAKA